MSKEFFANLSLISSFIVIIPLLISGFKLRSLNKVQIRLVYLLLTVLLVESISNILWYQKMNNLPIYHFYSVLEFLLFTASYKKVLANLFSKLIFIVISISFVLFAIVNTLFFQDLQTFNSNTTTLTGVVVILFSLCYFYALLKEVKYNNLETIIIGMLVIFSLALSVIVFFIIYQKRLLAQQKKHQKLESDYQKELLKTSISSQEEERSRIAKELHDDVGAMLTTTKLYFGQISPQLPAKELEEITVKMSGFFDDMIQSIRSISQDLRPVILEKLGLIEAIHSLVQTIQDSGKMKVIFKNNTTQSISKSKELNLYRIIQELITNTLKHALASVIQLELKNENNSLVILYEDNGKGLNKKNLILKKGLGLKNIESRLSILSGNIYFIEGNSGMKVKIVIK